MTKLPKNFEIHLEPHNEEYLLRVGVPNLTAPAALKEETYQGPLNWCLMWLQKRIDLVNASIPHSTMNIEELLTDAITNPGQFWGWLISSPKSRIVGISCNNNNCAFKHFIREQFNLEADVLQEKVSVLLEANESSEGEYLEVDAPRWLQWFIEDHDKVPQIQRINADMALFLLERAVHLDRELAPDASPESNPPHYAVANHHHSFSYLEGGQSIMPFADGHTYRSLKEATAQVEECLQEGYSSNDVKIYRLVEVPCNLI